MVLSRSLAVQHPRVGEEPRHRLRLVLPREERRPGHEPGPLGLAVENCSGGKNAHLAESDRRAFGEIEQLVMTRLPVVVRVHVGGQDVDEIVPRIEPGVERGIPSQMLSRKVTGSSPVARTACHISVMIDPAACCFFASAITAWRKLMPSISPFSAKPKSWPQIAG